MIPFLPLGNGFGGLPYAFFPQFNDNLSVFKAIPTLTLEFSILPVVFYEPDLAKLLL
jgi:hypothetical protein